MLTPTKCARAFLRACASVRVCSCACVFVSACARPPVRTCKVECSDEIVLVVVPFYSRMLTPAMCARAFVHTCAPVLVCSCFRVLVRTSSRAFVPSWGSLSLFSTSFLTSQVEGAFVQGLGLFTIEELRYSQSGAPWTTGPGAYKIPGFADIPVEFYVHLLRSAPNEKAVYSSKVRKSPHKRSSDSTRRITCASLKLKTISKSRNQLILP